MPRPFNVAKTVADFRAVDARLQSPTTSPPERKKLQAEAKRLQKAWKGFSGDDDLVETAFGKRSGDEDNTTA